MSVVNQAPAPVTAGARPEWAVVPKVNLLPPEIIEARAFVKTRQKLVGIGVGVVALCAGLTFWAQSGVDAAQADLSAAQAKVSQLNTEKATYAEVPLINAQLEAVAGVRSANFTKDVLWERYLSGISVVAGSSLRIGSILVGMNGETAAVPQTNAGPALAPAIGTVTISGDAPSLPDVATAMEALNKIPGMAQTSLSNASKPDDGVGGSLVNFQMVTMLSNDALSHRYDGKAQ